MSYHFEISCELQIESHVTRVISIFDSETDFLDKKDCKFKNVYILGTLAYRWLQSQ